MSANINVPLKQKTRQKNKIKIISDSPKIGSYDFIMENGDHFSGSTSKDIDWMMDMNNPNIRFIIVGESFSTKVKSGVAYGIDISGRLTNFGIKI